MSMGGKVVSPEYGGLVTMEAVDYSTIDAPLKVKTHAQEKHAALRDLMARYPGGWKKSKIGCNTI